VEKLAALGFDGVELGGFPPHPNPDDLPTLEQRQSLSQFVRSKGLDWSGLAANLWGEKLINTDDTDPYVAEFQKNVLFCNDLGIQTIRVDTVQPPTIFEEVDQETARARVVDTWKRCAEIAADAGINVVWE